MQIPTRLELIDLLGGQGAFLHDTEIPFLAAYAGQVREGTIVEIGAAYGASASILLAFSQPPIRVFSFDSFVPDPINGWQATEEECIQAVTTALGAMGKQAALTRWTLFPYPSHEVASWWSNVGRGIELLFIDGDHSYEGVKQDFEDWLPFMAMDGMIIIHDSRRHPETPEGEFHWEDHGGLPGPTQLANELRRDRRVILIDESYSMTLWVRDHRL